MIVSMTVTTALMAAPALRYRFQQESRHRMEKKVTAAIQLLGRLRPVGKDVDARMVGLYLAGKENWNTDP